MELSKERSRMRYFTVLLTFILLTSFGASLAAPQIYEKQFEGFAVWLDCALYKVSTSFSPRFESMLMSENFGLVTTNISDYMFTLAV